MATNLDIIEQALREINVISETKSASAEQGSQCLVKLNQMMEVLRDDGLDIGWFKQSATTDAAPIPDSAEAAIVMLLALDVAPQYGASFSAEAAAKLDTLWNKLMRKPMVDRMKGADMSNMPYGSGWRYRNNRILTDS